MCQPYIETATALSDKSQEIPVFSGHQKWTSTGTEARKVMVDFKLMLYTGKSS